MMELVSQDEKNPKQKPSVVSFNLFQIIESEEKIF